MFIETSMFSPLFEGWKSIFPAYKLICSAVFFHTLTALCYHCLFVTSQRDTFQQCAFEMREKLFLFSVEFTDRLQTAITAPMH